AYEQVDKVKAKVVLKEMDIQHMDFPDNTFDAVVSTCAFCSVPNPVKGFQEIRRVVKPDGKIVMLEDIRSDNGLAGKMLDLINPLTVRFLGSNVNRYTINNI